MLQREQLRQERVILIFSYEMHYLEVQKQAESVAARSLVAVSAVKCVNGFRIFAGIVASPCSNISHLYTQASFVDAYAAGELFRECVAKHYVAELQIVGRYYIVIAVFGIQVGCSYDIFTGISVAEIFGCITCAPIIR